MIRYEFEHKTHLKHQSHILVVSHRPIFDEIGLENRWRNWIFAHERQNHQSRMFFHCSDSMDAIAIPKPNREDLGDIRNNQGWL